MTVITPEMQKKQEEAMDRFLAKQVKQRERELRKLSKLWKVSIHGHDARFMFVRTYIPLAKYHARTYKEEGGSKNSPSPSIKLQTSTCWSDIEHSYVKMDQLAFSYPKSDPLVQRLTGSSGNRRNRILSEFWVPGFDYLENSGYYLAPEGWTPPAEWGVEDKREKKN